MMNNKPHILLVDDKGSVLPDIQDALIKIGIAPTFTFIIPEDRKKPVEKELPSRSQLDSYDVALIDLQFYDPIGGQYDLENLAGGTRVLPYLRENAPWLPTIAFSKLFSDQHEALQAVAGSFGFDGHIPRKLFPLNKINRNLWEIIINQAILLRKRAVLGAEFDPEKAQAMSDDNIICDSKELKDKLNNEFPLWREVIKDSFYYSDQIILSSIPGGFSGAVTLKAEVIEKKIGKGTAGNWLVKISKSPWKLNMEVKAHLNAIRSGQEYARTVPLLWNGVVVKNRIGLIAYQFAKNTKVALECLSDDNSASKLCGELKTMFKGLYPPEKIDDKQGIEFSKFINEWFSPKKLEKVARHFQDKEFEQTLLTIADGKTVKNIPGVLKPNLCWLHGDLHLRNILLGERNVLIDFAISKMGPLVLDLAKFASDLLLRVDELRTDEFPVSIENKNHLLLQVLYPINNLFNFNKDDIILYDIFLKIYLAIALDYPDVDDKAKEWVIKKLI